MFLFPQILNANQLLPNHYNVAMDANGQFAIAIETTTRDGSLAIGRVNGEMIEHRSMPQPTSAAHRRVDLLPAMAALCADHGATPQSIAEVYVSIGPGSFTGLRNAVTAAKMMALVHGCNIVAVPTIEVVAKLAPKETKAIAVGISSKKNTIWSAVYERTDNMNEELMTLAEPSLRSPDDLLAAMPRPAHLLGDHLPAYDWPSNITVIEGEVATPRADIVFSLGRVMAGNGQFIDAWNLLPCYARPPEAVVLWKKNRR